MALSNWDTLAIGPDGKSAAGVHTFKDTTLSIYKNWLQVSYKDVNISIQYGDISVGDVYLKAERNDRQNAIFVMGQAYHVEGEGKETKYTRVYFAGIGCYGYGDTFEEYCKSKGILNEKHYDFSTTENGKKYVGWFLGKGEERLLEIEDGFDLHPWVGVEKETLDEFKIFLRKVLELDEKFHSEDAKKWFESINWDELLRFNQGDAYFAVNLDMELPATTVGEVEEPIINHMIRGMKDSPENKQANDQ